MSKQMDEFFRVPQPLALSLLDALILFDGLGRDGRGRFGLRGVQLLNVSCGSGDGSPSLATTDADTKRQQGQ